MTTETTALEVVIPKDMFAMLGFSKSEAAQAVKEFSVLGLYLERKISSGKAAELLGIGKREFIRLLAGKKIPYFDYIDEELEEDFQAFDEWKRDRTSA
jgi:predicted HTH domain antitoxin